MHRAKNWADKKRLSLALAPAERTGAGPLQTSGGVALAVKKSVGSLAIHNPALEAHRGRLLVVQIEGMIRGGFLAVSAYFKPGEGIRGQNAAMLEDLGAYLRGQDKPWVVAADWNWCPSDLEQSGWPGAIGGAIVCPEGPTCTSGFGSTLDYFVLSEALVGFVTSVQVLHWAPTAPRSPVALTLEGVSMAAQQQQVVKWRPFPARANVGCLKRPVEVEWSWELGQELARLAEGWAEWVTNAETQLCEAFDMPSDEQAYYKGKAQGYQTKMVSLRDRVQAERKATLSPVARAWRQLAALSQRALAGARHILEKGWGWEKLKSLGSHLMQTSLVALEGAPQGNLSSHDWTAQGLVGALCSGRLDRAQEAAGFISAEAVASATRAAQESLRSWREWAKWATRGGASAAHKFAKGPMPLVPAMKEEGRPVVGEEAIQSLLREWQPRWCEPRKLIESREILGVAGVGNPPAGTCCIPSCTTIFPEMPAGGEQAQAPASLPGALA